MSLEERIQKSVDAALADLRSRVEEDVRSIVRELLSEAERERAEAVQRAEQHVRADVDQIVDSARAQEREIAQEDAWRLAEAKAEAQIQDAIASSRHEMDAALADAESRAQQAVQESVAAARVGEREAEMAAMSRLLESVRGLDGATTLSEVLDALGLAAGREAARAAVLVVRSDRLHGWKLAGFGGRDSQPKALDLAVTEAGVLGLAVSSARSATTRDAHGTTEGPPFAELPPERMGLAVPVIVGGRVVAVVYADTVAQGNREPLVPSSWPEVIEVLARHAARCLEALTVQKSATTSPSPKFWVPPGGKGPAQPEASAQQGPVAPQSGEAEPAAGPEPESRFEAHNLPSDPGSGAVMPQDAEAGRPDGGEDAARRLARLLLSDIWICHQSAVDEGRRTRSLLARLGPEIEQARRLYNARVPASLGTRAKLFHQELVATLAGGNPTLLGSTA